MRFTICTFNIWGEFHWPLRRSALMDFVRRHRPDILCVQELRPESSAAILEALPAYETVRDPFPGWQQEGNLFWNRELFTLIEHAAHDVGIQEKLRRLFCARLQVRSRPETLAVATAHYTWRETPGEARGEGNPRLAQAHETITALDRWAHTNEPTLFLGDLNDSMHALRILLAGGFQETYAALGLEPVVTWPARPIEQGIPELDDWILFRGPVYPLSVSVPDFFSEGLRASDHKPVVACFGLAGPPPSEKIGAVTP